MEPPNNGHIAMSHFVLCREVVPSSEVKDVLAMQEGQQLIGMLTSVLSREVICTVSSSQSVFFLLEVQLYCIISLDGLTHALLTPWS